MKQVLIALIISIGVAFAPLAEALCNEPDCAVELVKVEKKDTQTKALHVCACHHHSVSNFQFPMTNVTAPFAAPQAVLPAAVGYMVSAVVSPLLEPPSHA